MELEVVKKIIDKYAGKYKEFVNKSIESERYYGNDDDIAHNGAAAINVVNQYLSTLGQNPLKSADNRIPLNWHRILTDQKLGYGFTYPPQFDAMSGDTQLEIDWGKIFGDDFQDILKQCAMHASNSGVAWIHYWMGPDKKLDYYCVDPKQIFTVMDETSIKPKIKYLVRSYNYLSSEDGEVYTRYEVWDDKEVHYYINKATNNTTNLTMEYRLDGSAKVERHGFNEIPFIKLTNNARELRDLDMYKQIIDCLDKVWSGFANDIDDIQEIIWILKNYTGETATFKLDENGDPIIGDDGKPVMNDDAPDILQQIKARKYFTTDENGGIDTVRGDIPYEARMRFIDGLTKQLFISAMAVNPDPEGTGNSSGVYIDFLYSLLELKMGLLENGFRPGLTKLAKLLAGLGDDTKIIQTWTRNKPRNEQEIVQMIATTPDNVMSAETKTKVHPLVEDWQQERARIEEAESYEMPEPLKDEDDE